MTASACFILCRDDYAVCEISTLVNEMVLGSMKMQHSGSEKQPTRPGGGAGGRGQAAARVRGISNCS